MRSIFLSLLLVTAASCSSTSDITRNPAKMTDFVVGQIYELKKPVFLLHGTIMDLDKKPVDSEGELNPGTKLAVRQVVVQRSLEVGTYTDVFAEVLGGKQKGKIVNVGVISEVLKTGYTKRDPTMLEPVVGGE